MFIRRTIAYDSREAARKILRNSAIRRHNDALRSSQLQPVSACSQITRGEKCNGKPSGRDDHPSVIVQTDFCQFELPADSEALNLGVERGTNSNANNLIDSNFRVSRADRRGHVLYEA